MRKEKKRKENQLWDRTYCKSRRGLFMVGWRWRSITMRHQRDRPTLKSIRLVTFFSSPFDLARPFVVRDFLELNFLLVTIEWNVASIALTSITGLSKDVTRWVAIFLLAPLNSSSNSFGIDNEHLPLCYHSPSNDSTIWFNPLFFFSLSLSRRVRRRSGRADAKGSVHWGISRDVTTEEQSENHQGILSPFSQS